MSTGLLIDAPQTPIARPGVRRKARPRPGRPVGFSHREALIQRIRAQIAAGIYESPGKLDLALDRLLAAFERRHFG